ncbi:hypothetical protein OE88DRAFT_1680259 [Heliocybe sulcata]|uniref:FHA domain-containing protein n=1 Tax=Heliocybe sulcata TaxID=5364 RepID=A0A5C3N1E0_9AGAM|nr:hypothetical protein OE88DRAFT_1680259 [Heliocybe sulcata]
MWTITGPFDAKEKGDTSVQKTKLLKPGKTYLLGRKPDSSDLCLNHSRISQRHLTLTVGEYTPEDAANPSFIPPLHVTNLRDKGFTTLHEDKEILVNPGAAYELQDGDAATLASHVSLTVRWKRVCCFASAIRGKSSVSVGACARLGISVVHTFNPDVTHHLTPSFSLTTHIATSLLCAAHLVKPEWLDEVIRLGELSLGPDSLEFNCTLPQETKYRPTFSPSLPPALKVFRVWEPSEDRLQLFRGYRFIFVGEKGREIPGDLRDLVSNGGGQYEAFSVDSGRARLHQVLAKGKQKVAGGKGLVLVADEGNMVPAVGRDGWQELVEEARSYDLNFTPPENLVNAVVYTDVSLLKCPYTSDEHAGSNPVVEKASIPPSSQQEADPDAITAPPRRRLTRRATSSRPPSPGPSAPPSDPTPEVDVAAPRKMPLRRRARTPLFSIDDDSEIVDSQVVGSVAAAASPKPASTRRSVSPPGANSAKSTQTQTRTLRLKRRAGNAISLMLDDDPELEAVAQPPTKKFRALFEESDPSRLGQALSGAIDSQTGVNQDEIYSMMESQTQSVTQNSTQSKRSAHPILSVVAEEEEENSMASAPRTGASSKEVESQVARTSTTETSTTDGSHPAPLKAAGIPMNNSIKQPKKTGAEPGQPDIDESFLKAVASKKKGKKQEDTFDREFNNLRIAKPDLEQQQQQREEEREWEAVDDFGDYDVRGNFMMVVEMDVPEHRAKVAGRGKGRLGWEGKPDYKKFKHKQAPDRRATVELVASEENDYGMGTSYWRGSQSQSQSQPLIGTSPPSKKSQVQRQVSKTRTKAPTPMPPDDHDDDDDDFDEAPPLPSKSQPLFLAESQDSQTADTGMYMPAASQEDTSAPPTLRSVEEPSPVEAPPPKPPSRKRKAKATVIVDDDSDDGATFHGFGGRKKAKVK